MNIKNIKPMPYDKSIFPGISFGVEINYEKYQRAILGVEGWLQTDDEKIIAEVRELVKPPFPAPREIGARESIHDGEWKATTIQTTLVALLDNRALKYIEERRTKNRKHDVILTLNLKAKYVESRATISHIHEIENLQSLGIKRPPISIGGRQTADWNLLIYSYNPNFNPQRTNRWILSGNGGHVFLAIGEGVLGGKKEVKISSSDWIHDYAPVLGLGEYFIVEIPTGEKIIEKAWKDVEDAEKSFRDWNSKGVYANCREVGKVLDKIIKEKFGKDSFTYNERWGRAYLRFFNYLASLDLHLEEMRGREWKDLIKNLPAGFPHPKRYADYSNDEIKRFGKADAEHLIVVTKALIKYAEELLKEAE